MIQNARCGGRFFVASPVALRIHLRQPQRSDLRQRRRAQPLLMHQIVQRQKSLHHWKFLPVFHTYTTPHPPASFPAAPDHQKQFPTSEKYGILQQGNLHISQKYSHERIDTPCATAVNSQRAHARTHRLSPSFFNPSPYKINAQKTPLPASGAFCAFLRLQKNSAPASAAKSPPPSKSPIRATIIQQPFFI